MSEEKRLPSDKVTREFLIDLMHTLPAKMAEDVKEARADAMRAQNDAKFALASIESVVKRLEDWQASIQVLCRDIQTLWMIGPVWDITQGDEHDDSK